MYTTSETILRVFDGKRIEVRELERALVGLVFYVTEVERLYYQSSYELIHLLREDRYGLLKKYEEQVQRLHMPLEQAVPKTHIPWTIEYHAERMKIQAEYAEFCNRDNLPQQPLEGTITDAEVK